MLRAILLVTFISLSGCVVLNTTYITETNSVLTESTISTSTLTTTTERKEVTQVPPKVIINVPPQAQAAGTHKCVAFVLPAVEAEPDAPIFTELPDTSVDDDAVLAQYVKELRTHYRAERIRLEQAYQKWEDECR